MTIGRFFKRTFGFADPEEEEAELEGIDARVVPRRIASPVADESQVKPETQDAMAEGDSGETAPTDDEPTAPSLDPDMIFSTVVEVFNESLPDFMKQTVDGRAQREYLYEKLSADVKEYIRRLQADADAQCNRRWEGERRSLQQQMESANEKVRKEEDEVQEARRLQLSAERQKRALSERVHDLEKRIATLEAENEQYLLENKSLVNKIRVSAITAGSADVDDAIAREIEDLNARIAQSDCRVKELQASLENAESERNKNLEALAEAEKAKEEFTREAEELNEKLSEANNKVQTQATEIGKLQEALEQSRVKDDLGDAMLTDLNNKAAKARRESEELGLTVQQLTKENERLEHEAEQARSMAANAEKQRQEVATELVSVSRELSVLQLHYDDECRKLQEANRNLAVVEQMNLQLDKLEEAKVRNESVQREQKEKIKSLTEEIEKLSAGIEEYESTLKSKEEALRNQDDLVESLRKTIETNLYEHAQVESALRSEIERLKGRRRGKAHASETSASTDYAEPAEQSLLNFESEPDEMSARPTNKKKKVTISAIDDSLEDADWLVAMPAKPSKKPLPPREDSDFGYKEPERRPTAPDNPAQMSLW